MTLHPDIDQQAGRHPAAIPADLRSLDEAAAAPICSTWPVYAEDEVAEVAAILRSGRVNALHHGDRCRAFETSFARRFDMPHAIAVANGTLALELALRALGIGPGDDVIVPARSFIASASCVVAVGARPVFADVDPETQGLNASTVAAAITPQTKAIIPVHLGGYPCAIDEIVILAESYGLKVIEDCAQAHGAMRHDHPVGSFGDAAAFSFCTDKIISTGGEGGMLLLRDSAAWEKAWAYKDHGKAPNPPAGSGLPGSFRWLHTSLGSNYRLTEMQAGIGLRQLPKLDGWLRTRRANAAILDHLLAPLAAIRTTEPPQDVSHAYYKYYAFLRPAALKPDWTRDRIVAQLIAQGVPAGSGSCPELYLEAAFAGSASVPASPHPVAALLGRTSLMLPVDPTLDETQMTRMGEAVRGIVSAASLEG